MMSYVKLTSEVISVGRRQNRRYSEISGFQSYDLKIQKVINNCIPCILTEKKQGKVEGYLNPIEKGSTPLDTFHVDHLGPMPSTKKCYNHLFVVVDAFTKYTWIYPTKSTTTDEVIDRLKKQAVVFGNPRRSYQIEVQHLPPIPSSNIAKKKALNIFDNNRCTAW